MIDISLHNITKYYGADLIFKNCSLDLQEGERVGLIGPNGCGKTTLMKILLGEEDYQEGHISLRKGLKMGYLNQMPDYPDDMSVLEVMTLAFKDLLDLRQKMASFEKGFVHQKGRELEKALEAYGTLSQRFEHEGGYETETRLSIISEGLSLSEAFKAQKFGLLSGGEKTRVELAKTLLEAPDVLLLDEPSNHLDMTSIEWLEDFLKTYKGSSIIISHDRYFLDRVANRIIEMNWDKMDVYQGNYSYYVIEKERRFLLEMKYYEQQQKKVQRMEDQIKRYRIWGAMRDSDKMYRKAKELEKRLSKVESLDRPVFENAKVKFKFDQSSRSGKRVLEIMEVSKAFDNKPLFDHVNLNLFFGESLCLLGDNGTGKSTLLKMIVHQSMKEDHVWVNHQDGHQALEADLGDINIGSRIKVGYLPQEVSFNDEKVTVIDYFASLHDLTQSDARKELAKVLFTKDDVYKQIGSLSGGEKSRLKLCSLMYDQVNLMILDEPTNHLDIDSREILEETLVAFEGTILFVSHDRYFIAKIANRMAVIRQKSLIYYPGNYDYYRAEKDKMQADFIEEKEVVNEVATKRQKPTSQKVPQKYKYELEALEIEIHRLENQLEATAEGMEVNSSDVKKLNQLYLENESLNNALEEAYARWEELSLMMGDS